MPTAIGFLRKRYLLAAQVWNNPQATLYGTNQTFVYPMWWLRNVPDASMVNFHNVMTRFISQANRQRMTNNSGEMEICPGSSTDGIFFGGLRGTGYDYNNGGLTGGNGAQCALSGRDQATLVNSPMKTAGDYSGAVGSCLHEYAHSEDTGFFRSGQEPSGKAGQSLSQWSEMVTLFNDCQTNGADPGANGGHFITSFRVPQRLEAVFGQVLATDVVTFSSGNSFALSGTGASHNGVTLAAGNRILVWDYQDPRTNGIYVVASGAWTRSADTLVSGLTVRASGGTSAGFYKALYTAPEGTVTVGTTNMVWHSDVMLNSAGPGTTGGTGASRVQRWKDICTTNGVIL